MRGRLSAPGEAGLVADVGGLVALLELGGAVTMAGDFGLRRRDNVFS